MKKLGIIVLIVMTLWEQSFFVLALEKPNVEMKLYSISTSEGVDAYFDLEDTTQASFLMNFNKPGDWAEYDIEVENKSESCVKLVDVVLNESGDSQIFVDSGISVDDIGEELKPNEKCQFSIVVSSCHDMKDEMNMNHQISLTLVYQTLDDDTSSIKTGDGINAKHIFISMLLSSMILLLLIKKKGYKA